MQKGTLLPFDKDRKSELVKLIETLARRAISKPQRSWLRRLSRETEPVTPPNGYAAKVFDTLERLGLLERLENSRTWRLTRSGEYLAQILSKGS